MAPQNVNTNYQIKRDRKVFRSIAPGAMNSSQKYDSYFQKYRLYILEKYFLAV